MTFDEFYQNLRLLMWKNWILTKRHPIQSLIEILAPLLFAIILVIVRSLVDPETYPDPTYYHSFPINYKFKTRIDEIAWSPYNIHLDRIMNETINRLHLKTHKAFNNSHQLFNHLTRYDVMKSTLTGIQFNDELLGDRNLSQNLEIIIRFPGEARSKQTVRDELIISNWRTNLLYPLYQTSGPRNRDVNDGGYSPGYNQEGFLAVQDSLFRSIINYWSNGSEIPQIRMQRFPYPAYVDDVLLPALKTFISMIILLSFSFTCINNVKAITNEKEKQLKELMTIMGLSKTLLWLSWFLKFFIYSLITDFLIVILLKVDWYPNSDISVLSKSNFSLLYCFILLYMCSIISFCFMLSSLFSSANSAAMFSGLAWFFSYAPFLFTERKYEMLSLSRKLVCSLGSNSAMGFGFRLIVNSEGIDRGMQWSNLWTPMTPDDSFVLGHVFIMLLFDCLLYFSIAVYVENVHPGRYGVAVPWYFVFTNKYWFGDRSRFNNENLSNTNNDHCNYEVDDDDVEDGIRICNVSKTYDTKTYAVQNLSMNMKKGQISVLLGHNGAGKTTIMSVLTGMLSPTCGKIFIENLNIFNQFWKIRKHFGICLQNNVLFDELTVREHLEFFTCLKQFSTTSVNEEVMKYLIKFDLVDKGNVVAKKLSGGMKRKLCIGIALCGDSKIILLDEPTAGIDPSARHYLWSILEEEKKDRTILLSTHYMDEADILGDKIAILVKGQLQCYGSTYFLKKKFGSGYHLVMEIKPDTDILQITNFIRRHVQNVTTKNRIGSELVYIIPNEFANNFQHLFEELEESFAELGILSYGLSFSTLEDVFMKVGLCEDINYEQSCEPENVEQQYLCNDSILSYADKLSGYQLYVMQAKAMFVKHFISTKRLWFLVMLQWLIVTSNLIIAIHTIRNMYGNKDLPPLNITLDSYGVSYGVFQSINNSRTNRFINSYVNEYSKVNEHEYLINVSSMGIENYLLQQSKVMLPVVRLNYLTGVSFLNDIIVWFNNLPYHTAPLTLSMIYNSILKELLGPNYSLKLINYPLPFEINIQFEKLRQGNTTGFQMAFNIGFHMAFVSAFYILFQIRQRVSGFKHLQLISGVKMPIYWICAFISDLLIFCSTLIVVFLTLLWFDLDGFSSWQDLLRIGVLYSLFAYAIIPVCYLLSFCFRIPSNGYSIFTLISIVFGVILFIVVELLSTPSLKLTTLASQLDRIFLLFPHYALTNGILNQNIIYSSHKICEYFCKDNDIIWNVTCLRYQKCCDRVPVYFSWKKPGIAANIAILAIIGTVAFVLLLIYESKWLRFKIRKKIQITLSTADDSDVANEKEKVQNLTDFERKNYSLVCQDLTKCYGDVTAVDQLNLIASKYECFGLLGINGAGKTSTFEMLTGQRSISYGDVWVTGLNLSDNLQNVRQMVGYCPQFDAFINELNGKEILKLFLQIRGLNLSINDSILIEFAKKFDFLSHLNKQFQHYSGGSKRKLSMAVAFLGNPAVVYLDEPTAGMDPISKRIIWNILCNERDDGKCIILTSHSMEECEALCSRLAIMVNGRFKCLGSNQYLKSKFAKAFSLKVKLQKTEEDRSEKIVKIKDFISSEFKNALLNEEFNDMLSYCIQDKDTKYSQIFAKMEEAKRLINFEEYFISQSSLEEIFLMLVRAQRSD